MTTNIQLLRSSIAFKRPSAAPLLDGQAAINLNSAEPGLFWRLTNGQLAKAGPVAITDNGMEPNAAPAGETGNTVGEEWLDAHPALYAPILHVYNGTEFVCANGFSVDKSSGDLTLLRTLELSKLVAGAAQINGDMVLAGNLTPAGQNCAFYLGLPQERWDYFFGCNFDVSFDGVVGRDLTVRRDAIIERNLSIGQYVVTDIIPEEDGTQYVGASDKRWIGYLSYLNVAGDVLLGSQCSDTLQVNANSKFYCDADFKTSVIIGSSCANTFTVNATTTVKCEATLEKTLRVQGNTVLESDLITQGDVLLGTTCSDNFTVNSTARLKCDTTLESNLNVEGNVTLGTSCSNSLTVNSLTTIKCATAIQDDLAVSGNTTLGTFCSDTLTVNATSTFNCEVTFEDDFHAKSDTVVLGTGCNSSTINLNGGVTLSCDMIPNAHNARTIGDASNRLKALYATDVYTGDLHLKNEKGDWTMIEAEDCLTLRNNKTGRTFRLLMEEI